MGAGASATRSEVSAVVSIGPSTSSATSKLSESSKAGGTGTSDRGPRRRRSGVGSGSGIQLMSFASDVLRKGSYAGAFLHIGQMGDSPRGLVGRDETNADHGATPRAAHRGERGLGLPERRHEPEAVGLRDAPLALWAPQLTTVKLSVGRLEIGETDSLLSSHLALPPRPSGPPSSVRHSSPGRCRRPRLRARKRGGRDVAQPFATERHLGEATDVLEVLPLRLVDERVRDAATPGPSGPTDAVDVGVGVL